MKCAHCGSINPDTAKFCYSCGKPLIADDSSADTDRDTFKESHRQDTVDDKEAKVQDNIPKSSSTSNDSKNGEEKSMWELTKELASAAQSAGNEFLNEEPEEDNDTICPYCGGSCHPLQKDTTSVKTRGYSAGNGACGMCLLGPFGLLCGLCGTGSTTVVSSQTWWICEKCGKQHLSHDDVIKTMDLNMERMPLTMFGTGVVLSILLWWMFGMSFFHALVALAVIIVLSIGLAYGVDQTLLEQSGHDFTALSSEKKKEYFHYWLVSSVILLVTTFLACPLLDRFIS